MRILGIEIGTWSVKAAEMESRFRKLEILDLHEVRLPAEISDPITPYKTAIKSLLDRVPTHPDKIVTSLPPTQTSLRFLHLPIKQKKKVNQTFRFELEDSLPFNLDEAIVEHTVERTGEGSLVFTAVAPKKFIENHIEWLNEIGLDPDWLTFEGMGVLNFYLLGRQSKKKEKDTDTEQTEQTTLLMDVGHVKTNLAFLDEDRLEFFRSIHWGGQAITQAIASTVNLSVEEAEQTKLNDLTLSLSKEETGSSRFALYTSATHALAPLITDTQHSIVTYRAQQKKDVDRIILLGGCAKTPGFADFISQQLGKPTSLITETSHMPLGRNFSVESALSFGEAAGRSIVFARKAPLLFNFRKQELAKKTSLNEADSVFNNPHAVSILKFCGAAAVVLFIYIFLAAPLAESEAKMANKNLRKVFNLTFRGQPASAYKAATKSPKSLKRFIDKRLGDIKKKQNVMLSKKEPMLSILKQLSSAFPKDIEVDVTSINLGDRSLSVRGVYYRNTSGASKQKSLDQLRESISKIPVFENVRVAATPQGFSIQSQVDREVN